MPCSTSRDVDPLHPPGGSKPHPIFPHAFLPIADPFFRPILYDGDVMKTRLKMEKETIRLVIVDAVAHSRDSLATYLHLQEWLEVVGETGNATEAICLIRRHQPDVVIMDVNLPDADGFTVTRRLLALNGPPTVILLTVHRRVKDILQAQEAGALAYIEKSAGVDGILDILKVLSKTKNGQKRITIKGE